MRPRTAQRPDAETNQPGPPRLDPNDPHTRDWPQRC